MSWQYWHALGILLPGTQETTAPTRTLFYIAPCVIYISSKITAEYEGSGHSIMEN